MKRHYNGLYLRTTRDAVTKSGKALDEGKILMAVGDADSDWWVPVIFRGSVDYVRSGDVAVLVMT